VTDRPSLHHATYPLAASGAVTHWLACGTLTTPINEALAKVFPPNAPTYGQKGRWRMNFWAWHRDVARLKKQIYRHLPPFQWQPMARPVLDAEGIGGLPWRYAAAEADEVIDFSLFNFTPARMQGWLFALLHAERRMTLRAHLLTIGPARLWVNGRLRHIDPGFSYVAVQRCTLLLHLKEGLNEVYLQGEMLGWREARLALGLHLNPAEALSAVRVELPLGTVDAAAWARAEEYMNALIVDRFFLANGEGVLRTTPEWAGDPITVTAEIALPTPKQPWAMTNQTNLPVGRAALTVNRDAPADLPLTEAVKAAMAATPGENTLTLTLRPADGTPLAIHREVWGSANPYRHAPYGTYEGRRREALEHLAAMPYDLQTAMAAVHLGRMAHIPSEAVATACHFMNNRQDCADFYAIGMLAALYWYPEALLPKDRAHIEQTFRAFKFWLDEPGVDGMCYFTENHQVLFHVTEYLAGALWRDWTFTNSGRSGADHVRLAAPRIRNWIGRRLQGGYSEWDSNAYLTLDVFAMLALVEFAPSRTIRQMAAALLDKTFFMIACQSFRGTLGSTHGRCYVSGLKSGRVENTSPLGRIAWGMGILNGETRATGLLALARTYRLPTVIQQIGAHLPPVLETRARHRAAFRPKYDCQRGVWDVTTLTRRTPDGMLSAALNHRPYEFGIQEHLWQATLSPEAAIFTTYPGNAQEHGHARPNFWAGSLTLPRVGMHGRTVLAHYQGMPHAGLGYTHAYFPTAAFDEWYLADGWAFARVGEGYAALWGSGDLHMTAQGRHAYQEVRLAPAPVAMGNSWLDSWLCHIGSKAEDGSFETFMRGVRAATPEQRNQTLRWTTPEGERLDFGAALSEPLTVNGAAVDWTTFPHYGNRYTETPLGAAAMTITHEGESLSVALRRGGK